MRLGTLTAAVAASALAATAATNEIIVLAARIETPLPQMAATVNVATADDIENSQVRVLPELLQTIPGVAVSRSGGPGQQTSVYIRGAKPQHTLILIDGVRMNGQLDLAGYDMANLQLVDIERVEVLKGPQSPLYGSDAMSGVINIVTKKGDGKPSPYLDVEGGAYHTYRAATGISGSTDALNYNASVSYYEREGQSALKNNPEKDGTQNTTVATRLGANPTDNTELNLVVRYIDAAADYDDGFGTAHDQFKYDSEQLITRAEGRALTFNDSLETKLGASYLILNRDEYGWDSFGAAPTRGYFDADTLAGDWVNSIYLHEDHTLLLGIDAYLDEYDYNDGFGDINEGDLSNTGVFGTYQAFLLPPWVLNLGIRYDDHSEFDGETTYQASSAYTLGATGTKVKGSYGTAFKAPSSYQLFSSFGNPNLNPESSRGWEVGLEQQIVTNRVSAGLTYFNTEYDDLIDFFDPDGFPGPLPGAYANIREASTEGVEIFSIANLLDDLRFRIGYTYLDNDDDTGGSFSYKRPAHQIDTDLNYDFTKELNVNLYAGYIGDREDVGGTMEAYVLVNLAMRYQITENVQLYGRIENLLDEEYETVAGYNTDALSAYLGIKVSL